MDSVEFRVDSVRDSVVIKTEEVVPAKKRSNIVTVLKWLFAVVVAVCCARAITLLSKNFKL